MSWMVEYLRGALSYIQHIESMEFVTTTRGARSLIHHSYGYTLNRRTEKDMKNCLLSLVSLMNWILKENGQKC